MMKEKIRKLCEDFTVSDEAGQKLYDKLLDLYSVSNRRELLITFITWATEQRTSQQQNTNIEIVDNFIESN
jgi:hypothetical protein